MPEKLKRIFQQEYGKKKGTRIFYAWQNKRKLSIPEPKYKHPSMIKLKKISLIKSMKGGK